MIHPPSLWLARSRSPEEREVVIVGAGIVGLSTAYWLRRLGRPALVVEADRLGARSTGRSTGFLVAGGAFPPAGGPDEPTRQRSLALWAYGTESRDLLRRELLDPFPEACGWEPEGGIRTAWRGTDAEARWEESHGLLVREGFDVEWLDRRQVEAESGGSHLGGALRDRRDGGVDPVGLLGLLADRAETEVRIGRVRHLSWERERVLLDLDDGTLRAERVVLATNAYATSLVPELVGVIQPVRIQALAARGGVRELRGEWIVSSGPVYVRQLQNGTVVAAGSRQPIDASAVGLVEAPTASGQRALEEAVSEAMPVLGHLVPTIRWAGVVATTTDGRPRIGHPLGVPGAVYAAGLNGQGLALGFLLGRDLARWVVTGELPSFGPRRDTEA